ncbi:MAG: ABC transporter permease [Rhodospirillales bacterium]|nr:ABC transporter permease [Rhodospirillales bacterium]
MNMLEISASKTPQPWPLRMVGNLNPLIIGLAVLYVAIALWSDRFLALSNQMNITRQVAVYLVIAMGQTFVISSRGIDLSVGSVLGFVGCVLALMLDAGVPVPVGVAAAILLGAAFGAVNGLVVTKLKVNPLIATLGMLVALRGLTHILMGSTAVTRLPSSLVFLGQGFVGPVPVPALLSLAVALVCWWLYYHTRFGRHTVAIGSNEDACGLSGIRVDRQKILIYAFQGACVGFAATLIVGRLNAASPDLGLNYELHIIAAVVLGGTALYGGMGTIFGTVLGIFTIGVIENGMVLVGANFHVQRVLIGTLLVAAVAYQEFRRRQIDRRPL